jgi:DNA-directed RNA polymerase subunit RPC12/RpoP
MSIFSRQKSRVKLADIKCSHCGNKISTNERFFEIGSRQDIKRTRLPKHEIIEKTSRNSLKRQKLIVNRNTIMSFMDTTRFSECSKCHRLASDILFMLRQNSMETFVSKLKIKLIMRG